MWEKMLPWIGFNLFVLLMLAIDLGVFHRKEHEVTFREALTFTGVCVFFALVFNAGVYFFRGKEDALAFFTGYLIEQSLSVDNLFVFLIIFSYFKVPAKYQHGVLFWGILGALLMRGFFIVTGVALINRFHWILYIFGALLVITGIRLIFEKDKEIHPDRDPVLRIFRRFMPCTPNYVDNKYFVRIDGRLFATPLFVVLIIIDTTDFIFAMDSIPAVMAISQDPFIIYTSNGFAILSLRSLYFVLARVMGLFHHLHYGLAAILIFIGVKMLIEHFYKISIAASLMFVVVALALSIGASLLWPKKDQTPV